MCKRIISFNLFEDSHIGENLANLLIEELGKYEISEIVFTLTLDNASNKNIDVDHIQKYFLLSCQGADESFHIRCICHILNLIVQSAFSNIKPIIEKFRDVATFISSSSQRIRIWKQISKRNDVKARKIPKDVDHRWNSTYLC